MFRLNNGVNHVSMKYYIENLKGKIIISDFQALNYGIKDLENVIVSIVKCEPIDTISLSKNFDVVDGQKRIFAINSFIDGKIRYNGKNYFELSKNTRNLFEAYELAIYMDNFE